MRHVIAGLVVIVASGLAAADPAVTRLSMKRTEGTNLHIANHRGAIHWAAEITITVELRPDHQLEAVSTGTRSEHNAYAGAAGAGYDTDDDTAWTTRWTGSWATAGDALRLDLVLADHACRRTKTTTGYQPATVPCEVPRKRARLTCTSEQLQLDEVAPSTPSPPVAAWRCHAKSAADLAESPWEWVLGKTTCIEIGGGRMQPYTLQRCPP